MLYKYSIGHVQEILAITCTFMHGSDHAGNVSEILPIICVEYTY